MSIEHIASEALRLPPRQKRAMLAGSLWESLSDLYQISAGQDCAETLKVALERDHQLEAGEVQALSHDEMMSRLRR